MGSARWQVAEDLSGSIIPFQYIKHDCGVGSVCICSLDHQNIVWEPYSRGRTLIKSGPPGIAGNPEPATLHRHTPPSITGTFLGNSTPNFRAEASRRLGAEEEVGERRQGCLQEAGRELSIQGHQ